MYERLEEEEVVLHIIRTLSHGFVMCGCLALYINNVWGQ
jgi:uncharacterized protein YunC (DUF1805 family)